jgi:hypothetical protein
LKKKHGSFRGKKFIKAKSWGIILDIEPAAGTVLFVGVEPVEQPPKK